MTYKEMFDDAFKKLGDAPERPDDAGFADAVRARARTSGVIELVGSDGSTQRLETVRVSGKRRRIASAVGGAAAAAAVIAGVFFGAKYLNEYGGLKEGAGAKTSALSDDSGMPGVTAIVATMPVRAGEEFPEPVPDLPYPETLPDISSVYGEYIQFHDADIRLESMEYDGVTLTEKFAVLYKGSDYDSYSPEYIRTDIAYAYDGSGKLEYITDDNVDYVCTTEEAAYADSFSHICTYSVPVKLEPGKAYAVGIEYFNPNGDGTQPIEAHRQRYSFTYMDDLMPAGTRYEFENCIVEPSHCTFDGMTLGISYTVTYKGEPPESPISTGITLNAKDPGSGFVHNMIYSRNDNKNSVRATVSLYRISDTCTIEFTDGRQSFGFTAEVPEYEKRFIASGLTGRIEIDGGYKLKLKEINAAGSAISFRCDTDSPYSVQCDMRILLEDGTEILPTADMPNQELFHEDRWLRYQLSSPFDVSAIDEIYLGGQCVYFSSSPQEMPEYSADEITDEALTVRINQQIIFTAGINSGIDGAEVHFTDYYFDGCTLKLHYDMTYPTGRVDKDRIFTEYAEDGLKWMYGYMDVIGETADTVAYESVTQFAERYDKITLVFRDDLTKQSVPFELKCPVTAAKSVITDSAPKAVSGHFMDTDEYDYEIGGDGKPAAKLTGTAIYPSAVLLTFDYNDSVSPDDCRDALMSIEPRVALKSGREVKLHSYGLNEINTLTLTDGSAYCCIGFDEVIDPADVCTIYVDNTSIYRNGDQPINGNAMNGTSFDLGDCIVGTSDYYYDGLYCNIYYDVIWKDGKAPSLHDEVYVPETPVPVFLDQLKGDRGNLGSKLLSTDESNGAMHYCATLITMKPLSAFDITFRSENHSTDEYMTIRREHDCIRMNKLQVDAERAKIGLNDGSTAQLEELYVSVSTVEIKFSGVKLTSENIPDVRVYNKKGVRMKLSFDPEQGILQNLLTGAQYLRYTFEDSNLLLPGSFLESIGSVYVGDSLIYGWDPEAEQNALEGGLVGTAVSR